MNLEKNNSASDAERDQFSDAVQGVLTELRRNGFIESELQNALFEILIDQSDQLKDNSEAEGQLRSEILFELENYLRRLADCIRDVQHGNSGFEE